MNLGTRNFFCITIFETRHILTARTGSYKSTPLIALNLTSNAVIFLYSISLEYLILEDLVADVSTSAKAIHYLDLLDLVSTRGDLGLASFPISCLNLDKQMWLCMRMICLPVFGILGPS
ncbi:hypothetical protein Peur_011740 [Populus x canadensis]